MDLINAGLDVAMMEAGLTEEEMLNVVAGRPNVEEISMSYDEFMIMVLLADANKVD